MANLSALGGSALTVLMADIDMAHDVEEVELIIQVVEPEDMGLRTAADLSSIEAAKWNHRASERRVIDSC